jgi:hypothetical protein
MKKLILTAVAGAAALALGACDSGEPAADETVVETETPAAEELAPPADASPTDMATDAAAEASPAATESPAM